jgi:cytochrome c biogenesis protein CcmG, thiol:disulfide interchange protein DsbE
VRWYKRFRDIARVHVGCDAQEHRRMSAPPSRARIAAVVSLVAAVAALAIFGLASAGRSHARLAPALPAERLSGPPVSISSLVATGHGRPAVIAFWASWCGPCIGEAAELERFAQSAAGRGRLVGVDISDDADQARAFIARHHWTFANVRDAESAVGHAYGVIGPPATFIIDRHAHIVATLRGPQTVASLTRAIAAASA